MQLPCSVLRAGVLRKLVPSRALLPKPEIVLGQGQSMGREASMKNEFSLGRARWPPFCDLRTPTDPSQRLQAME